MGKRTVHGKTCLITGASRGIGAAAARKFAAAGARLALMARSGESLAALAEELDPAALPLACDVASWPDVEAAFARMEASLGAADVLIVNAGVIQPIAHLARSDPAGWAQAVSINLTGAYHAIRAALPAMKARGGGTVLLLSSGAAHRPVEGWSHYCASKAGAAMLLQCLDLEERESGIRAIGLSPGTVATDMQRQIKASGINPVSRLDWSDHIPPEWVAEALLWMCTDEADAFLGQEISLRDPAIREALGLPR